MTPRDRGAVPYTPAVETGAIVLLLIVLVLVALGISGAITVVVVRLVRPVRAMDPLQLPPPRTPREAEHFVCGWMRRSGARDAAVTQASRDGGVDVRSRDFVAEVKHYGAGRFVPVSVVRALHGVAVVERRQPLLFTSGRFTKDGHAFAERAGVALFWYGAAGEVRALSSAARRLLRSGLGDDGSAPSAR